MRRLAARQVLRAARLCGRPALSALPSAAAAPSPASTWGSHALRASQLAAAQERRLSTAAATPPAAAAAAATEAAEAATGYGAQQIQVGAAWRRGADAACALAAPAGR